MKTSKSSLNFSPFINLKGLLKEKPVPQVPDQKIRQVNPDREKPDPESEQTLFMEAMADVKPLPREMCIRENFHMAVRSRSRSRSDEYFAEESVSKLTDLIKYGTGFVVSNTPEYIEGRGCDINPEVTRRLHRGDFSIQAYIDLHGMNAEEAEKVFGSFLNDAIMRNKRNILIIHGRGLSSPKEPVLKAKVIKWLTHSPWHKWIIAFTSARSCDGGAGATYVLLRQRPLTKRFRKKSKTPTKCI